MKKVFRTIIVLLTTALACFAFSQSSNTQQVLEGKEKYTPSKIEWTVLWANATLGADNLFQDAKFGISFREGIDPNTIEIVVGHLSDVDRSLMNTIVESKLKKIRDYAREKSWSWLKVKEKYWKIDGDK